MTNRTKIFLYQYKSFCDFSTKVKENEETKDKL